MEIKFNAFESVPRLTLLATFAALIALVLWLTGISLAVVSFNHSNAAPYYCCNHVISELGFPFASPLTWLFNGTLAIAGLMLLPISYALGAHLRTRLGYVAAGFGILTCLAISGIGMLGLKQDFLHSSYVFMSFLKIHLAVADVFFLGWFLTVTLFTINFCRRWSDSVSRLMAFAGFINWPFYPALFAVAIYANPMQTPLLKDLKDPALRAMFFIPTSSPILSPWLDSHRPHIWWPAALEWGLAWSVLLWHGIALIFLWKKTKGAAKHSATL